MSNTGKNYCSYELRNNKEVRDSLNEKERNFMLVLMAFGATIDPHGYDNGDYSEAMGMLLDIDKGNNNE